MHDVERVGEAKLVWGESARWDDRRQRLYLVDCATQRLHWLDGGEPPLHEQQLPSLPTGTALAEDGRVLVCLDDGVHVVDPDAGATALVAAYPAALHGRANDACSDGAGNLIAGTLNMAPGPGSLWQLSAERGWRHLADDMGNVNGPVVTSWDGVPTLVVGDTVAGVVWAFDYDSDAATVERRRVVSDHRTLGGAPDGAALAADGAVWSCVLRSGRLVRITADGRSDVVELPLANPSSVAFGGATLDRLFLVSIALELAGEGGPSDDAGRVLALDVGARGVPETRVALP